MSHPLRWTFVVIAVLVLILLPFALFGAAADAWAERQLHAAATAPLLVAALVVGFLAADIVAPVPSSIVATFAGATLGLVGGAMATLLGLTLGCVLGYWLGHAPGRQLTQSALGAGELQRLEAGWATFGDAFLVLARAVPVLAEASVLFAGMSAMPKRRFFILTGLANVGLAVIYSGLGAWALSTSSFLLAFGATLALPALAWMVAGGLRPSSA